MKISDLKPNLYNKNVEMNNIINSEENELENNLKTSIDNSFYDTFAKKATIKGISNFEKMFNIQPNVYTETIEFRRDRIINRLVTQIPFTENYLKQKLNEILGKDTWSYVLDYNNYTLTIYSLIPGKSWYMELLSFLDKIIPCNIDWTVTIYSATWGIVSDNFVKWVDIYNANLTWQELMDAEWL